jgi:hypothetical protein
MRRRIVTGLLLLSPAAVVACASVWVIEPFVSLDIREYFNRIPFDSPAWKDAENREVGDYVRLRMVDDLLRRPMIGMSKGEIDDLLGPPTQTSYFANYDYVY